MTLPHLNTPIAHDGSPECPVHYETIIIIETVKGYRSIAVKAGGVSPWSMIATYTIIARAPADRIAELEAVLRYYADDHVDPNVGPWGVNSTDFGNVAREALK